MNKYINTDNDYVNYNQICSIFENIVEEEYKILHMEFGNRLQEFNKSIPDKQKELLQKELYDVFTIWLADQLDTYKDKYTYNI